jgi:hypothetical protein
MGNGRPVAVVALFLASLAALLASAPRRNPFSPKNGGGNGSWSGVAGKGRMARFRSPSTTLNRPTQPGSGSVSEHAPGWPMDEDAIYSKDVDGKITSWNRGPSGCTATPPRR